MRVHSFYERWTALSKWNCSVLLLLVLLMIMMMMMWL